jgi:hypothetical protein
MLAMFVLSNLIVLKYWVGNLTQNITTLGGGGEWVRKILSQIDTRGGELVQNYQKMENLLFEWSLTSISFQCAYPFYHLPFFYQLTFTISMLGKVAEPILSCFIPICSSYVYAVD